MSKEINSTLKIIDRKDLSRQESLQVTVTCSIHLLDHYEIEIYKSPKLDEV